MGTQRSDAAPPAGSHSRTVSETRRDSTGLLELQRRAGNAAVAALLSVRPAARQPVPMPRSASPIGVVQRLAVQVVPGEDEKITDLRIIGRPASPHTSTMGDHSTAFMVQQASVRRAIIGRSLTGAVDGMAQLVVEMARLPGVDRLGDTSRLAVGFRRWWERLVVLHTDLVTRCRRDPNSAELPLLLQDYVSAYLEAREIVPLSTVNVSDALPSHAGKGKGEASHARKLLRGDPAGMDPAAWMPDEGESAATAAAAAPAIGSSSLAGPSPASGSPPIPRITAGDALIAIRGLFDSEAVGIAANSEPRETRFNQGKGKKVVKEVVNVTAPGLTGEIPPSVRITMFVEQHLKSLDTAYPWLWRVPGLDRTSVAADLHTRAAGAARKHGAADLAKLKSRLVHRLETRELIRKSVEAKIDPQSALDKAENDVKNLEREIRHHEAKHGSLGAVSASAASASGVSNAMGTTAAAAAAPAVSEAAPDSKKRSSDEKGAGAKADQKKQDPDLGGATFAVQVGLTATTPPTVARVDFGGRPRSPFGNTMGAHTTSWVVHEDRVRTAVFGKTLDAALKAIRDLAGQAREQAKTADRGLEGPDAKHLARLKAAELWLGKGLESAAKPEVTSASRTSVLWLQELILRTLTLENLIPGATFEASNTTGHGEGGYRSTFLAAETGSRQVRRKEVTTAFEGLLDIEEVPAAGLKTLRQRHLDALNAAYPRAMAIYKGARPPAAAPHWSTVGDDRPTATEPLVHNTRWRPDPSPFTNGAAAMDTTAAGSSPASTPPAVGPSAMDTAPPASPAPDHAPMTTAAT